MKKIINLLSAVLFSALLWSCANSTSYDYIFSNSDSLNDSDSALVKVNCDSVRTILPEFSANDFSNYVLTGYFSGEEKELGTFSSYRNLCNETFKLEEGQWSFTLTVSTNNTVFSGTTEKEIKKGMNEVSIVLSMISLDLVTGIGSARLELTVPQAIKSIKGTFCNPNSGSAITDIEEASFDVVNGKVAFVKRDVPAGAYLLKINLYNENNKLISTYKEIANIVDEKESYAKRTVSTTDKMYEIAYKLGHATFKDNTFITSSYFASDTDLIILPGADDISNYGRAFEGWYLTSDFSGEKITEINPSEKKNFTLYGKWANDVWCTADEFYVIADDFTSEVTVHFTEANPLLATIYNALRKSSSIKACKVRLDFDACTELKEFTHELYNNKNIISISIPENVETISNWAFVGMTCLEEIRFNAISCSVKTETSYGNSSQLNAGKNTEGIKFIVGPKVKVLPAKLFFDGYFNLASDSCAKISRLVFDENSVCEEIGEYFMYYISSCITELELPPSVKSIGSYAFPSRDGIKKLTIHPMESIGTCAFGANNLYSPDPIDDVYFMGTLEEYMNLPITELNYFTFDSNLYINGQLLEELTLENDDGKFYGFKTLKSVKKITVAENATSGIQDMPCVTELYFNSTQDKELFRFSNIGYETEGARIFIGDEVTKIPGYCFYKLGNTTSSFVSLEFSPNSKCTEISSDAIELTNNSYVKLPKSLKKMGNYAIKVRNSLETKVPLTVYFHGSLEEWYTNITFVAPIKYNHKLYVNGNQLVEELSFPEGTTTISCNENALSYISSLKTITIPETVTKIENYSFSDCTFVETLNYKATKCTSINGNKGSFDYGSFDYIGDSTESGTVVNISKNVESIPDHMFKDNTCNVVELNFEEGSNCSSFGNNCFRMLRKLKKVVVPEKVKSNLYGFNIESCGNLELVTVRCNIDDINDNINDAFKSCGKSGDGITVRFSEGVDKVPAELFNECKIKDVDLTGIKTVGEEAFYKCTFPGNAMTIPASVKEFKRNAFQYVDTIENVYYEGNLEDWIKISFANTYANPCWYGSSVTMNGKKITEVTIDGTAEISAAAFAGNLDIKKITVGEDVTSLKSDIFTNCCNVEEINFNPTKITSGGSGIFVNNGCGTEEGFVLNIGSNVKAIPVDFLYEYNSPKKAVGSGKGTYAKEIIFKGTSSCESIGNSAFRELESLKEVKVPASVKTFGQEVFYGSKNIENVYYEGTVSDWLKISFKDCSSNPCIYGSNLYFNGKAITEYSFGDDVTEIPVAAFAGCNTLKEISIGKNVEKIGEGAFANCSNIEKINYNAAEMKSEMYSNTNWGKVFEAAGSETDGVTLNIGPDVKIIPRKMFEDYNTSDVPKREINNSFNLVKVNFADGSSCETIDKEAFYKQSRLKEFTVPASMKEIGKDAFYGVKNIETVYYEGTVEDWMKISFGNETSNPCCCGSSLICNGTPVTEVVINEGKIPAYVFMGCADLKKVTIGENVEEIYDHCFVNCPNLAEINYNAVNAKAGANASRFFVYSGALTEGVTLNVGPKVTEIFKNLFTNYGYSNSYVKDNSYSFKLTAVNFSKDGADLTIKENAFYYLNYLKEIYIPKNVKTIEKNAFYNTKLTKVGFEVGTWEYKKYETSSPADLEFSTETTDEALESNASKLLDCCKNYYSISSKGN